MKKILILLCFVLVGCATSPSNKPTADLKASNIEQMIIKGKTTKIEVMQRFGEPNHIMKTTQIPGVVDVWTYSKFSTEMTGNWATMLLVGGFGAKTSMKGVTLMVYFDKDEVVKDYTFTQSNF